MTTDTERIETVVVGAGQAGLAVAYHLKRRGLPFVVLEANARIGDTWRQRWDSLRLPRSDHHRSDALRLRGHDRLAGSEV